MIIVTDEQDTALERIVPEYLKGPRCVTRRVHWAIDLATRCGTSDQTETPTGTDAAE